MANTGDHAMKSMSFQLKCYFSQALHEEHMVMFHISYRRCRYKRSDKPDCDGDDV